MHYFSSLFDKMTPSKGAFLLQAAQAAGERAGQQLQELVTAKGLKGTLARAAAADYWETKFEEAMEHAARERNITALKVQRGAPP